jgi:hypothetical protein
MTIATQNSVPLKVYSLSELARIYQVDWRTFKKWLRPFEKEIGEKQGRYYNIPQVKVIFEKLSLPSSVSV